MNNLTKKIVDNLNKLDEMLTKEKNFTIELRKHLQRRVNICYAADNIAAGEECYSIIKFMNDYRDTE